MKRNRKTRRFGGRDIELTEGPYDSVNHRYMRKKDIVAHVDTMERKQKDLEDKYNLYEKEYEIEQNRLDAEKAEKKKDKREQTDKEFQKNLHDSKIQEDKAKDTAYALAGMSAWTADRFGTTVSMGITGISSLVAFFIKYIVKGVIGIAIFLKWVVIGAWSFLTFIVKDMIRPFLGSIMNNVVYHAFKYFFSLLFALLFVVVVFLLLFYGVSIVFKKTGNENNGYGASGGTQCSSVMDDVINININGLGYMSNGKIDTNINLPNKQNVKYKPSYEKSHTPQTSMYNIFTNPFRFFSSFTNTPAMKKTYNGIKSSAAYTRRSINSFVGNDEEEQVDKPQNPSGRSDNIINIDTGMFFDKKMLLEKGIRAVNTVVNIARPKDIVWELPISYDETDYQKLPQTLLDNASINSKTTIIIPWKKQNNFYKLSCSDSYFQNNPNEKAKVLIDNIDSNTCTFDNSSKPITYSEDKKREINTPDLSRFIS